MNSFNLIKRVRYQSENKELVYLDEYIVFTDEREEDKYIVFKFMNTLNQRIHAMKFQVFQYDEKQNLIAKSTLSYDKLDANGNESFTPNAKMKAEYACDSIRISLISATFEKVKWEDGVFTDIPYTFKEYVDEVDAIKAKKTAKELKKQKKVLKKEKKLALKNARMEAKYNKKINKQLSASKEFKLTKKQLRHSFRSDDIYAKNGVHGFYKFCAIFFTIVIGIASGVMVIVHEYNSTTFMDGEFDYTLGNGNYAYVSQFDGKGEITIPATAHYKKLIDATPSQVLDYYQGKTTENPFERPIYEFPVAGTVTNAFERKKITAVHIESENGFYVSDYSFRNCRRLSYIDSEKISYVGSRAFQRTKLNYFTSDICQTIDTYAFNKCTALNEVVVPNAFVAAKAFNDASPTYLCFNETNVSTLGELFGTKNKDIPSSLQTVQFNCEVPEGFYYGVPNSLQIINPYFDSSMRIDPNEPVENYETDYSGMFSYVDDHIVAFNANRYDTLEIPEFINTIDCDVNIDYVRCLNYNSPNSDAFAKLAAGVHKADTLNLTYNFYFSKDTLYSDLIQNVSTVYMQQLMPDNDTVMPTMSFFSNLRNLYIQNCWGWDLFSIFGNSMNNGADYYFEILRLGNVNLTESTMDCYCIADTLILENCCTIYDYAFSGKFMTNNLCVDSTTVFKCDEYTQFYNVGNICFESVNGYYYSLRYNGCSVNIDNYKDFIEKSNNVFFN